MRFKKTLMALAMTLLAVGFAYSQDKTTGSIKGKVRVEVGSASGVVVAIRQGEREVGHVSTDK